MEYFSKVLYKIQSNPFFKWLSYEDKEHIAVVDFLNTEYPHVVFTHVPSEGKKSVFERFKYSLMGSKKGMCDFVILHPKFKVVEQGGVKMRQILYHGLVIELKAPEHIKAVKKGKDEGKMKKYKGVLSTEQKVILQQLNEVNYRAIALWGADEAIKELKEYLQ